MSKTSNPWLPDLGLRPRARLRLFCFPYAGGNALIFRKWSNFLPPGIEVCPIQLPGRGGRLRERPFTSMSLLVDAIEPVISGFLDKPFAFFGHSMGAAISFELAHKLRLNRKPEPVHLFLSGRRAPQLPDLDPPMFNLPESEFLQRLRELEGTPPEVLENQELLTLVTPLLRADFEVIETVQYVARPPLTCPITIFGGTEDKDVTREDIEAWREQSSGPFHVCMMQGNHFFLHRQETQLLQVIAEQLASVVHF